jgi:RNA polymerase sigma-70 factor (ECF subfamily)
VVAATLRREAVPTHPSQKPISLDKRRVGNGFFAPSRDGDVATLLKVLDPDVQLRIDSGTLRAHASLVRHGAEAVGIDALVDPERITQLDPDTAPNR